MPWSWKTLGIKDFGSARSGKEISAATAELPAFTGVTSPSTKPKKKAQNKARVTQKVVVKREPALGPLFCEAGHSHRSNMPRDRACPGYPLCPGPPELHSMKKTTFQFFQREL